MTYVLLQNPTANATGITTQGGLTDLPRKSHYSQTSRKAGLQHYGGINNFT